MRFGTALAVIAFEIACLGIVGLWFAVSQAREPGRLALQAAAVAIAAWIAEDTCIHFYGVYAYDPSWGCFLDRVPVTVVCIWPAVILSDRALLQALRPRRASPFLVGALVLADAALIEPVSVAASLWSWSEPGLFGVPPVAVFGWGLFGALAAGVLELADRRGRAWLLLLPLAVPLGLHAGVCAAWWILLRWISLPVPGGPAAGVAWIVSSALVVLVVARGVGRRVPLWLALSRAPPGLLFLGLLAAHGRGRPDLVAWALAFTPPHLAILLGRRLPGRPETQDDPSSGA
ncbi:MAG: carotenoid biosynthesis protein [Deltaproteobacteria bacterium]|nr:carotenoid biosynthesis protein [Deltaproteobacteria bacterium]